MIQDDRDCVSGSPEVRILERIDLRSGRTGRGNTDGPTTTAVVLDVETTGLDPDRDVVIELAMRRIRYDGDGVIVEIGRCRTWREDPGFPLPAEIIGLTGLTDRDLKDQRIDDDVVARVIATADLVIAHNCAFDRPMMEMRLPQLPSRRWACSCEQIDWRSAGFEGRALGYLAMQAGWYFDGHRAQHDVDAVVQLLRHEGTHGLPLLYELDDNAHSDSHLIETVGAPFAVKDDLRLRGYRWNPEGRVWWREVSDRELVSEQSWLAREVYAPDKGARGLGPRMTRRDAYSRYRRSRAA
ncbi:3'-5' exonuclease [Aurantiacibacter spongiae]|uniref:DNA polymerase III subunit epsilon n=1 Tax=Aurantiacibacter spongiae TaxID=2488860 RepID=A0A3N5DPR5_9SPHN|nr:3'-5' exonuclease [Aurantiacibacter spongiae]RPF71121.1 DNA polymerase III subunit epsilon [Aurantiacibacter spongiae]